MNETMAAPTSGAAAEASAPLFHSDAPGGQNLASYPALDLLADLALHKETQTPLTIGLFGEPGVGKTHALRAFLKRVRGLAAEATDESPFLDAVVTVPLCAHELRPNIAMGLASALHRALLAEGPQSAAARLGAIAIESSTDPLAATQEASRKLGDIRQRLSAEHQSLEQLKVRREGLNESLLFGAANTKVDDYAKRHRKRLQATLKGFGFTGDPTATYKELLRDLAARPARLTAFTDTFWAYAGQTKLLVWAIVFFLVAIGCGLAERSSGDLLTELRNATESAKDTAGWLEAHTHWLDYISRSAIGAGGLCLALNIWRAMRFTMPMLQGLRLLEAEASTGRMELDGQIARQLRQAHQLDEEAQKLAGLLQAAEARVRARGAAGEATSPFAPPSENAHGPDAETYLHTAAKHLDRDDAPKRIIFTLDGLEALPAQEAAALVDAMHLLLNRPGFLLAMAADAQRLSAGWSGSGEASQRLERYVQAPFNIRMIRNSQASIIYAHQLLGSAPNIEERPLDADSSALDYPLKPIEAHILGKLAHFAGDTPRAMKRFVNCWRLARPLANDSGALALMLALDQGGTSGELAAMGAAMDLDEPGKELQIHPGEPRLAAALTTVNSLRPSPLTNGQAHAAWLVARDYSLPAA